MKLRESVPVVMLVFCVGLALYVTIPVYLNYRQTKITERQLRENLERQEQEIQALRREFTALRSDYRAIERVAREKFGLCREGETIYHVDAAPAAEPAAPE